MDKTTIASVSTIRKPEPPRAVSSRSVRWVLIVWALIALAVALKTAATPRDHTVFPKNAIHAMCWWEGTSLYAHVKGLGHFPYPPTHAILLTPFALLGLAAGGILWTWMNMAVYVTGLRRLIRDVLGEQARRREATYLALAMIGALRGIWNAQGNALIIGLFMLAASALMRRRWWLAAFLMMVPVYLKTWPIAMALLLVAVFPRPMAWRFLIALAVGGLLPFLTQRPGIVLWQYHNWVDYMGTISSMSGVYRDLRGVLYALGRPPSTLTISVLQVFTGLLMLAWCLWIRKRIGDTGIVVMLTLSAGAAWCMLFGVATEYNTVVVLAPSACWILISSFQNRRGRFLAVLCFVLPMMLGAGAVERVLVKITRAVLLTIPTGSLLCMAWLARYGPGMQSGSGGSSADTAVSGAEAPLACGGACT